MNYQKIDYDSDQVKMASQLLNCDLSELAYYAWPQMFGSTAGPFYGIGGQAMSLFTIEAYSDGRSGILFCKGRFWKKVERFNPCDGIMGKYR